MILAVVLILAQIVSVRIAEREHRWEVQSCVWLEAHINEPSLEWDALLAEFADYEPVDVCVISDADTGIVISIEMAVVTFERRIACCGVRGDRYLVPIETCP